GSAMNRFWIPTILLCSAAYAWSLTREPFSVCAMPNPQAHGSLSAEGRNPQSSGSMQSAQKSVDQEPARLARGKKLVLKDGNFHFVRSYERRGDRVRYYSLERGSWEEIPASMVDWEATKKAEADAEKADTALLSKVHAQEEATKIETTLDVDASLQVAPGVFLPPGEGMFAGEGKFVTPIPQVDSELKKDRANTIKRVLSPLPIPAKQNVEIPGPKAKLRFNAQNLEFYLREAPPDEDAPSSIERSHRPGSSGPEV